MGERHKFDRKRTFREVLSDNARCIYCVRTNADEKLTIEHMPPRGMFLKKLRPKGLEFPCCSTCNQGTKAADAAAAFFARIDTAGRPFDESRTKESKKYLLAAESGAPGLIHEIFNNEAVENIWFKSAGGVMLEGIRTSSGPIAKALLDVFAAKLGMAMYHHYTGQPLPLSGGVHTMWFLNAGLSQETADTFLSGLPDYGTLQMGRQSVSGQFEYRSAVDGHKLVATLAHFNGNVQFFSAAMAEPSNLRPPERVVSASFARPGELISKMPERPPATLLQPDAYPNMLLPGRDFRA